MTLLKSAKAAGVNINIVNIMTMDYGTDGTQGRAEGTVAIASANGTFSQLKSLYPNLSTAQIWAMIGITPMIGYNDDSAEIFRASDATAVTNFAMQNGVGLLSYWALQRDEVGTTNDLDRFSRVNTSNYQFYNIMAAAKTATQPVTTRTGAALIAATSSSGRARAVRTRASGSTRSAPARRLA